MSGCVTVEADPDGRAGHAVIRVHGAGQFAGPADFRIRRDDYDDGVFGAHGWQVADELLPPDVKSVEGNDLVLHVGPWIVQHVVSGVYHFAMPAARLETTVFWPDLPLLADGASNMVAEPARAATRMAAASRPQIQRPVMGAARTRPEPSVAPPPVPTDPSDDTIVISAIPPVKMDPPAVPVSAPPLAAKPRGWIPLAVLLALLVIAAGGGYYGYRLLYPPPVPEPVPTATTPEPPLVQPGPASTPPAGEPDLQNMTAAEALRSGAPPEALLREAQRRMQLGGARRSDALLLMQGAADRDYAPAHAALGQLYDPNLPRPPEIPSDARQAALHYRAAARGGDGSIDDARAALKRYLEQQAQGNDLYAPLILKDFWP